MIHFDFIAEDEEAEFIFNAIQDKVSDAHSLLIDILAEHGIESDEYKRYDEWVKNHIEFVENLQKKMINKHI